MKLKDIKIALAKHYGTLSIAAYTEFPNAKLNAIPSDRAWAQYYNFNTRKVRAAIGGKTKFIGILQINVLDKIGKGNKRINSAVNSITDKFKIGVLTVNNIKIVVQIIKYSKIMKSMTADHVFRSVRIYWYVLT